MKIIFNSKEKASLSEKQREKILEFIESQGLGDFHSDVVVQNQESFDNVETLSFLTKDLLLNSLVEIQHDALELEEQVSSLKERNNYLEEKVNWLRGKSGKSSFIPTKASFGSSLSLVDSSLQFALVEVINKMESRASERTGFSFSRSKRERNDRALIHNSEYFDKNYVARQLKELGLKVKDPLEFFVSFGAELELSPSEKFDAKSYLAMNPDVKSSGINPLLHYIKHGKAEGRVLI
ncbi:glycosyl transferase family 1 [Alteromonas sp. BZK5]|uniref:glycosyl transferase family 1 n=1 Tax=Alteromonas sp. BZK5 TaxID=1904459 RepID=UPI0016534C74|nr:glycosyl transferase family 1 [Alteromonas sp. BZK5]MBC6986980.1 glycosyl transferase family 1 [Alteromonas sp. BZK5]